MSNTIFKDATLDKKLSKDGYVIVPLLTEGDIEELVEFYTQKQGSATTFFTTLMYDNQAYKVAVNMKIQQVFSDVVDKLFVSYTPFWGNFFSKQPGSFEMPLHADLQYVNEEDKISLNIWCLLSDTNKTNGTLGIVPRSHQLMRQIRGTNITDAYRKNAKAIADKYGVLLEFKKGEAIIYDHRLLHYSAANRSSQNRIAATLVMVPEREQLVHYFAENEGDTTFFKYNINTAEDLIRAGFLKKPIHLPVSGVIENYCFEPLTVEDFDELYR